MGELDGTAVTKRVIAIERPKPAIIARGSYFIIGGHSALVRGWSGCWFCLKSLSSAVSWGFWRSVDEGSLYPTVAGAPCQLL